MVSPVTSSGFGPRAALVRTCTLGSEPARLLALSAGGQRGLTASTEGKTATVWDLTTRRRLGNLEGHTGGVRAIALSRDGRYALTTDSADSVRRWNVDARGVTLRSTLAIASTWPGRPRAIDRAALSDDGRLALVGNAHVRAHLWDLESGRWCQAYWCQGLSGLTFGPGPDGSADGRTR